MHNIRAVLEHGFRAAFCRFCVKCDFIVMGRESGENSLLHRKWYDKIRNAKKGIKEADYEEKSNKCSSVCGSSGSSHRHDFVCGTGSPGSSPL